MNLAKAWLLLFIIFLNFSVARADVWRGTAPFCNGECLPGEIEIRRDSRGDGNKCWSGEKVLCGIPGNLSSEPITNTCSLPSTQMSVRCVGFLEWCALFQPGPSGGGGVMQCSDTYQCGFCFGFW